MKTYSSIRGYRFFRIGLILAALAVMGLGAQIPPGTWHCIQAEHADSAFTDFDATFEIVDAEYYQATFQSGRYNGTSNTRYEYSASGDTLLTRMPQEIILSGGSSSYSGGEKIYDYYMICSQELWDKAAQVALGWGYPEGATGSKIHFSVHGDTLLELKSVDGRTVLSYTAGAKRPRHNPVAFAVNMKIQQQLGNFNPGAGDRVVVRGDFNDWATDGLAMEETDTPGIYGAVRDFPGSSVGTAYTYKYVILKSGDGEIVESDPARSFVLEGHGNTLGIACFDRRARADEVEALVVTANPDKERRPATAYNPALGTFLVVWQTEADDVHGRLLRNDGSPEGPAFPIASGTHREFYPQAAYNTRRNEWLVVWQDDRNEKWDIYGVRLSPAGEKRVSPESEPDLSFAVSKHDSSQNTPRIAYNDLEDTYLVVWVDFRNAQRSDWGFQVNTDVYGQRVAATGALMDPGDIPVAFNAHYDERYCDVAFCGTAGKRLNEWLVVFSRSEWASYGGGRIWGVRIDGKKGVRLNTWGEEIPAALGKPMGPIKPPFMPEFPIGWDGQDLWGMLSYFQGSPHVESNDDAPLESIAAKASADRYPIPEFLVVWTESRSGMDQDIYSQRVAYFPDSTAYRLGFKSARGPDSLFTAVLLDRDGNWPADPMAWITWPNYRVSEDPFEQSWNNVSYSANDGSFLVLWNDWRATRWNGEWGPHIPAADIYGQRAYLNPADSSLVWVDHDGSWTGSPLNTPIAFTDANEGNRSYPAVAFGVHADAYLVAYEYTETDTSANVDIVANLYQGAPPAPPTAVDGEATPGPSGFTLGQNYPNPFNPDTRIAYVLKSGGRVTLRVYDILGREVATLFDGPQGPGAYQVYWDGRMASGAPAASGVYIARLTWTKAGESIHLNRKMVLSR